MTVTALPTRIAGFPFPFRADAYRYSTNVEPARLPVLTEAGEWGAWILDIDDEYADELAQRQRILAADPTRLTVLPHMRPACWDALHTLLRELAAQYPDAMELRQEDGGTGGGSYVWRNDLLGIEQRFTDGEDASLPGGPLGFLGSQIQDDIVLLDQREGSLWADAGLVTFAADWSMRFDVGMRFLEVHGPVPRVHEEGIISRAERFLMRLEPGQEYRRTNWTMSVGRRLDQSTEVYPEWGRDRRLAGEAPSAELAERLQLRVEVQHLIRLGASGAVMFLIRTYMVSLAELAQVPAWRARFGRVLTELPDDMADYKGLTRFRSRAADWLLSPTTSSTSFVPPHSLEPS
ncbi:heme-dependent oxidative N-demethylase family protein [Streptomyces sp. 2A115]|uniref:heme-dependent oxidative N-demethylase family protein n=1 Tax=Streptomyces sp. 2A115 TaxID=3457439 RepID=UPI003FD164EF